VGCHFVLTPPCGVSATAARQGRAPLEEPQGSRQGGTGPALHRLHDRRTHGQNCAGRGYPLRAWGEQVGDRIAPKHEEREDTKKSAIGNFKAADGSDDDTECS